MERHTEVKWNSLRHRKEGFIGGSRNIDEPLPVIRTYEENGHIVKVYPPARSPDLDETFTALGTQPQLF